MEPISYFALPEKLPHHRSP